MTASAPPPPTSPAVPPRPDRPEPSPTRERIVDAGAEVMRRLGMARSTTKEIAREAGYSEATLYKHFDDKEQLFLAVMHERFLPGLVSLVMTLPGRVGQGTVPDTLAEIAAGAVASFRETMLISGALFADPKLLATNRATLQARGAGPHMPYRLLAGYLADEQRAGRVSASVDPDAAASLLIGACFSRAFLAGVMGDEVLVGSDAEFTDSVIRTLLAGLATEPRRG